MMGTRVTHLHPEDKRMVRAYHKLHQRVVRPIDEGMLNDPYPEYTGEFWQGEYEKAVEKCKAIILACFNTTPHRLNYCLEEDYNQWYTMWQEGRNR